MTSAKFDKPVELTSDPVVGLFRPAKTLKVGKLDEGLQETRPLESVQQSTEEVIEFRPYRLKSKRKYKDKGLHSNEEIDQKSLEPARRL